MAAKEQNQLIKIRKEIDAIDDQLLALLQKRLARAKEIGELKSRSNQAKWDPLRERQIYERLVAANRDEFPTQSLLSIFHEIITTCRLSQKKIDVAYLGPEATFSHLAGVKYFGHAALYRPVESIEEIFVEVERGRTRYGIVPVENSIDGSISPTLDSFMKHRVKVSGEVSMEISHNLVNQSGEIAGIKTVASHPQPLAQCREWLKNNLPGIPCLPVSSTAVAAQMAAKDPTIAAIASSLAIKLYQLQVVVKGIEDYRGNTTRFLVIGSKSPSRSGSDKTSLLLGLMDRPGALNEILTVLSEKGINLAKIESRPIKGKQWKYLFFIDMHGHIDDQVVREGCERLKELCSYFEWLGSYPKAAEFSSDL